MRLLAEVTFGTGALAVIGGTVGVIAFLSFFTGTEVGLQGYAALDQLGTSAFTGFLSAYFNTREIAPLIAGLALSATVGCGFTAQIGAMRINEEIDALEVMGVPSLPFLVTTRIIAGFIAVIPLYVLGLLTSYFGTRAIATSAFGQSTGTYDHYFNLFLPPEDVYWSFLKVLVFSVVIILTHCYYGYRASGGPAGVGLAVGRAVRFSIVAINIVDLFLSLAIWGSTTTVRIAG
jgi:phospholipid/cholesterol/gamma-HCH transport system permease protein